MNTSAHLDWISATYPQKMHLERVLPPGHGMGSVHREGIGHYGYANSYRCDNGALIMDGGRRDMGVHLVLPGEVLGDLREHGLTDRGLMCYLYANGAKCSRVDVAVNIHGGSLTPRHFADAFSQDALLTRAVRATHVQQLKKPDATFYLGSRQSDAFLRVYDKAAQSGTDDGSSWLRLELECKNARARTMARAIEENRETRPVINRAIKEFVDMPKSKEFQDALADQDARIEPVQHKMTSTLRWLLDQVAPAMVKYQLKHPEVDAEMVFMLHYRDLLKEARGGTEPGAAKSIDDLF